MLGVIKMLIKVYKDAVQYHAKMYVWMINNDDLMDR